MPVWYSGTSVLFGAAAGNPELKGISVPRNADWNISLDFCRTLHYTFPNDSLSSCLERCCESDPSRAACSGSHWAEAKRILAPYLERLVQAIEQAWERWWQLPAREIKASDARARAAFVYCLICDEIRERFDPAKNDLPGVSLHETPYHMLWLNIEGLLVLRFKKLDNLKRGSNITTKFQTEFTLQLQLPNLPPEAGRLTVGYQLDRAQSKIRDILVTYRVGDVVKWSFSARESDANGMPALVPAPLPFPVAPAVAASGRKARVIAKNPDRTAKKLSEQIREAEEAATEDAKESRDS